MPEQMKLVFVIVLIVVSGIGDSHGFLHAATIWQDGRPVVGALIKSGIGFGVGIVTYWLAICYLNELGMFSTEI